MPRSYCKNCSYPLSTCLCSDIRIVRSPVQWHILQHPAEANAAKNTARLVKLCIPDTQIWLGESPTDFASLIQYLSHAASEPSVLYPCEHAQDIGTKTLSRLKSEQRNPLIKKNLNLKLPLSGEHPLTLSRPNVLVLDATWRKAFKMWQLNPWLHRLPAYKLSNIRSRYDIRKCSVSDGLSTLESIYHFLTQCVPIHEAGSEALLHLFQARQNQLKPRQSELS